jgi:hypothetical protein
MLQTNATMTKVVWRGVGDYDTPAQEAARWEGIEDCYLASRTERVNTGQGSELRRVWIIYVRSSFPLQFQIGDQITLSHAPRGYMPDGDGAGPGR